MDENLQSQKSPAQVPQLKRFNKKKLIIGVSIGALIVLVGFTIVLAAKVWDPLWNPFSPNPSKILKEAMGNMSKLNALHEKLTLQVDNSNGGDFSSFGVVAEGDADNRDQNNPKSQFTFNLTMEMSTTQMNMLFGMDLRTFNDILYFRITSVPFIFSSYLSQMGIDTSQWVNKWYSFDPKELGLSMPITNSDVQAALQQDLMNIYFNYPPAKPIKRLAEENINGEENYHFLMTLDKDNLKQFLVQLVSALEKEQLMKSGAFTDQDKQKLFSDIETFFKKSRGFNFEIFVGKNSRLINLITASDKIPADIFAQGESGDMDLDFSLQFSSFNKPIEITKPADSGNIVEVLMNLMSAFPSY